MQEVNYSVLRGGGKTLLHMAHVQREFMESAHKEFRKLPRQLRGMQYDYVLVDEGGFVKDNFDDDVDDLLQRIKGERQCMILISISIEC